MKIAFVTNLCAHYNVGTFERLARMHNVDYMFFSAGDEWYWPKEHGSSRGNFDAEYVPGVKVGGTRVSVSLIWRLLSRNYEIYVKCINGRFALPATYLAARIRRKPFILWTGIWNRLQTPAQRLFWPLTLHIYRHADAIVVYGEHVKRYLVGEGVAAERIFVAPHAIDNSFYAEPVDPARQSSLRASLNVADGQKIVLYLGRLEESKGVEFLLQAFAQLRQADSVLVVAGKGTRETQLRQQAQDLGIAARTRFCGYVPIKQTPLYFSLAWVFAFPSITVRTGKEPWGVVVNESFNQGVPVVATDAVGAAAGGLVQDGINGAIVPERDASSLAWALDRLLGDPVLRQTWGARARQTVAAWNYEENILAFLRAIDYVSVGRRDRQLQPGE
jgi:glycosyltransferase involved in cell wall biosynthesis